MISGGINLRELERSIQRAGAAFRDPNETAIARWGVSTCRRLSGSTQAKGDTTKSKKIQEGAVQKDANNAVWIVDKAVHIRAIKNGKMKGLVINGKLIRFRPDQVLATPIQVFLFIEKHRDKKTGRIGKRKIPAQDRGITTRQNFKAAHRLRNRAIGKAKGGWIGAGIGIGKFQKVGSRITIGKNVSSYAHKFRSGGSSGMKKSQWNPEGSITNNFEHVSFARVLAKSDIEKALIDGGKNTLQWYEKTMEARLRRTT